MAETADRAEWLAQLCAVLWPSPASSSLGRLSWPAGELRYRVLPSASRPRLVVPADARLGASATRRYGSPNSAKSRVGATALAGAMRAGGGRLAPGRLAVSLHPEGDAGIGSRCFAGYLSEQLGEQVEIALHLGAARANRKPVVQILDRKGATVGFAKLGIDGLTDSLVRRERATLCHLAQRDLRGVVVPRVLFSGEWRGHDVLALSALPVWQRHIGLRSGQLEGAMVELATSDGTDRAPLPGSRYVAQLSEKIDRLPPTEASRRLRDRFERVATRFDAVDLPVGTWHGDWVDWNMASVRTGLLLWDWERFARAVPLGFDSLHFALWHRIAAREDPARAALAVAYGADCLLRPFGLRNEAVRAVTVLYLVEVSARYLADRQAEAGHHLGDPSTWLLPTLEWLVR